MPSETLPVVFRRWRDTRTAFALFPTSPSDYQGFSCYAYERVGGHGGADYFGCVQASGPASAEEVADLKQELERIGYRLKAIKRASWKHHEARRAAAKALR